MGEEHPRRRHEYLKEQYERFCGGWGEIMCVVYPTVWDRNYVGSTGITGARSTRPKKQEIVA